MKEHVTVTEAITYILLVLGCVAMCVGLLAMIPAIFLIGFPQGLAFTGAVLIIVGWLVRMI